MSSGLVRESRRPSDCESEVEKMFESKLGVVRGESLAEDMEDWGDELVLRREWAPDGEGPKEKVEIIRSDRSSFECYCRRTSNIGRTSRLFALRVPVAESKLARTKAEVCVADCTTLQRL